MSLLAPKPVEIRECIDIALGVDHSVFLVQSGAVYTCGQNTYHQVGINFKTYDNIALVLVI